ncbi:MAG: reverse transcriptase family protein [Reichenbachiella sp.]|uniref:reverse transcriptase family protein n=1 Tax=Reichenbachiella sp. TaxID=2184521 RepID=UPI003263379B
MINTLKHLAYILKVDLREIETVINGIDNFYYEKSEIKLKKDLTLKLDKNGKPKQRVLNPSIKRLKEIQKRIQKRILLTLDIPDYAYGAIKGKDNVMNAKRHQGKKYVFTTDLTDFFPSISHHQVFEMFRIYGFSPTVSRTLTQLTTYKGRLPQGTPTSPIIANLVFVKTGKNLEGFAKENELTFTSFVDDLTFSAPKDFKELAPQIIQMIQQDGFRISHKKTNYKTNNPIVTGVVVKNNLIDLTEEFKIKIEKTKGKTEEQLRGEKLYKEKVLKTNNRKKRLTMAKKS